MREIFVFIAIFFLVPLASCKTEYQGTRVASLSEKTYGEVYTALRELSGAHIFQAKVNPNRLTIDSFHAGVQNTEYGDFVRLYFIASIERDYLQILRCPKESRNKLKCRLNKKLMSIHEFAKTPYLQDILDGKTEETVNTEGKYACWKEVTSKNTCSYLGDERIFTAEHYVDLTAPDNRDFFYVARVCVVDDRIDESYVHISQNCSPYLAVSNTITINFSITEKELKLREKLANISKQLNEMTVKAYSLTLELSKALADSEEKYIENQSAKNKREAIAMITGMTIGAVGAVYTSGIGSISSGLESGKALGAAFADIVASPDDYPKSCTKCLDLVGQIAGLIGNINNLDERTIPSELEKNPMQESHAAGHIYEEKLAEYEEVRSQLYDMYRNEREKRAAEVERTQNPG